MPMPTSFDPSFDAWERCNNLVLSWIFNSVEPQIAQSVLLKTRFAQGDKVRIFELQQELASMKQGSNSVTQYFTEITILWEELDNYRPLPDCTCVVACLCETGKNGKIYKNEDYIMKFLSGLNDEFEVVKTQILMMEPFPDIDKTYSLVIQHERRLNSSSSGNIEETQVFINATESKRPFGRGRGGYNGSAGRGNLKICSYYEKTGHTVEVCYKKHSYPGGSRGKNYSSNHVIGEGLDNSIEEQQTIKGDDASDHVSLTKEQYQNIMHLLQQSNITGNTLNTQIAAVSSTHSMPEKSQTTSNSGFDNYEDDWFC
ncbi:uncharacterized protein LOC114916863 [Cajanus cajan]|uniref:uncharacterized protein LOC114916863 n=1 Tax=Cajanus cajan TaxID=3821 RepID=UPI0010FB991D|nr:uncharacterized protein LOC114916863 [Cajanus cajan]